MECLRKWKQVIQYLQGPILGDMQVKDPGCISLHLGLVVCVKGSLGSIKYQGGAQQLCTSQAKRGLKNSDSKLRLEKFIQSCEDEPGMSSRNQHRSNKYQQETEWGGRSRNIFLNNLDLIIPQDLSGRRENEREATNQKQQVISS